MADIEGDTFAVFVASVVVFVLVVVVVSVVFPVVVVTFVTTSVGAGLVPSGVVFSVVVSAVIVVVVVSAFIVVVVVVVVVAVVVVVVVVAVVIVVVVAVVVVVVEEGSAVLSVLALPVRLRFFFPPPPLLLTREPFSGILRVELAVEEEAVETGPMLGLVFPPPLSFGRPQLVLLFAFSLEDPSEELHDTPLLLFLRVLIGIGAKLK